MVGVGDGPTPGIWKGDRSVSTEKTLTGQDFFVFYGDDDGGDDGDDDDDVTCSQLWLQTQNWRGPRCLWYNSVDYDCCSHCCQDGASFGCGYCP